ncbi:DUF4160 domain-containing protein [Endozoicomonas numazuensis]|uniref:DUF4160 domain-containing protein n=1 Tax=Endozoicomonas numazuensis TaxID=1137799 RepID=A0A081NIH9_9GAMM|nr:DUF4160 domain-containing protein [Endozoicomonas numazuensis]KEQ18252.1 hypothetical protein GZ78_12055 [Endozoicomonas numazuensis]
MPKLFTYLGITIFFYSNEHEPIHVHGTFGGRETKAEIILFDGVIREIKLKDKGPGLEGKKRKKFEEFVHSYAKDIVEKWVDFFVMKKSITSQIITKKVKNVKRIG